MNSGEWTYQLQCVVQTWCGTKYCEELRDLSERAWRPLTVILAKISYLWITSWKIFHTEIAASRPCSRGLSSFGCFRFMFNIDISLDAFQTARDHIEISRHHIYIKLTYCLALQTRWNIWPTTRSYCKIQRPYLTRTQCCQLQPKDHKPNKKPVQWWKQPPRHRFSHQSIDLDCRTSERRGCSGSLVTETRFWKEPEHRTRELKLVHDNTMLKIEITSRWTLPIPAIAALKWPSSGDRALLNNICKRYTMVTQRSRTSSHAWRIVELANRDFPGRSRILRWRY